MKKIAICLIILFLNLNLLAQEHLSFKGIPIEGSMISFCQKLKTKGFSQIGSNNNITVFSGDFTGRQASIGVAATDDGQNVHSVVVLFESNKEWKSLVSTYNYYKDLYTRKYGEPHICQENNPSSLNSNVMLMNELTQGTVTYTTIWEAIGGTIELSIDPAERYGEGLVIIKYRDDQNVENKIKNDLDEI